MRIALCTDYFYPRIGGVSSHVANLASELEKRGHEVRILTKRMRGGDLGVHLRIVRGRVSHVEPLFPIPILLTPPKPADIRMFLRKEGFDIVHACLLYTSPSPRDRG